MPLCRVSISFGRSAISGGSFFSVDIEPFAAPGASNALPAGAIWVIRGGYSPTRRLQCSNRPPLSRSSRPITVPCRRARQLSARFLSSVFGFIADPAEPPVVEALV